MSEKKYKLTDETLERNGHILHKIVALKDFSDVHKGDKGGWIEKEENLSQEGNCWVYREAKVYDEAKVFGNASVYGNAEVYDKAEIRGKALVYDRAKVYGFAEVYSDAQVYDRAQVFNYAVVCCQAQVYGWAQVYDKAYVADEAQVYDDAEVYDKAEVGGNAKICNTARVKANAILRAGMTEFETDYVIVGPQGSRYSFVTYHIPSGTICTGCFTGTLDEFEAAVKMTHKKHPKYLQQYKRVISALKRYKQ